MLRVELLVEHVACVGTVGIDDEQPCVAATEQLVVEPLAFEVHVREASAVHVAALDVVLETHELTEQPSARERGGLGTEAADGLRGMVRLRGVAAAPTTPTRFAILVRR